jgi:hypothetical protein
MTLQRWAERRTGMKSSLKNPAASAKIGQVSNR